MIVYPSLAISAISFLRQDIYLPAKLALIVLTIVIFTKPLVQLFPTLSLFRYLLILRRQTGQSCAIFALTHVITQVYSGLSLTTTFRFALNSGPLDFQFWGFLAFILFLPLLITSNDLSLRLLKRNWFYLHKLIHPLYIFVLLHYGLQKGLMGVAFAFIVLLLLYGSRFLAAKGIKFG